MVEDGATVTALAMAKVKGGYVALRLEIEGWQVTDAEVLTDGAVPQHHAEDAIRVAFAEQFLDLEITPRA